MFGRKRMYKKGLADAMSAYEGFSQKQEAAIAQMRKEVQSGQKQLQTALSDAVSSLEGNINGLYNYLNSYEKAALYNLSTPLDIKELDAEEKQLLLAVLYQLSFDEGDRITNSQRAFVRSVQQYLEIVNPQTEANLSVVGDIDSLDVQKAFLQVVLEFLYLQDSDEISEDQEEFLSYFSVNRKQAELIEERVSRLYNAMGIEGIAQKYGYVPEDEIEEEDLDNVSAERQFYSGNKSQDKIIDNAIAKVISEIGLYAFVRKIVETENYCLIVPFQDAQYSDEINKLSPFAMHMSCIEKRTGAIYLMDNLPFSKYRFDNVYLRNVDKFDSLQDTAALNVSTPDNESVGLLNLQTMAYEEIDSIKDTANYLWHVDGNYIVYYRGFPSCDVVIYDYISKSKHNVNIGKYPFAVSEIVGRSLYLMINTAKICNTPRVLYEINIDNQAIVGKYTVPFSADPKAIKIFGNALYCFANGSEYSDSLWKLGADYESPFGVGNRIIYYSLDDEFTDEISITVYPETDSIRDMDLYFPPIFSGENVNVLEDRMLFYLSDGCIAQLIFDEEDKSEISILVEKSSLEYIHRTWGNAKLVGPVPCFRKWVYYKNKNSNKPFRVNMDDPKQVEAVVVKD